MIAAAFFLTILGGLLGAGYLGSLLNWPDAGAVVAIAIMGSFILWEIRKKSHVDEQHTDDSEEKEEK